MGMVLAVLQRRAGLKLGKQDVYAATVGGVRLTEPSVDLAVAVALASSAANLSVPHGVVAIGEVGLAGEVRRVAGLPRRLAEAERMGFRRAIVPAASGAPLERADGLSRLMQVQEVARHPPGALRRSGDRPLAAGRGADPGTAAAGARRPRQPADSAVRQGRSQGKKPDERTLVRRP